MAMAVPSFARDAVTVVRPGVKEIRGTQVQDWTNPTRIPLAGCSVQPANAGQTQVDEARVNRVEADIVIYAPPGADVKAGDRVEWNDDTWQVVGVPQAWASPTGRVSHTLVEAARWGG